MTQWPLNGWMMTEDFGQALNAVCGAILANEAEELRNCPQNELDKYWFFKYDETKSLTYNIYEFTKCLEMYRSKCRRWEEYNNGYSCVVERVRDIYLWPKIKEFEARLK